MAHRSDHLLRTFAGVPVGQRVLVMGDGPEDDIAALVQLGFEIHACTESADRVAVWRASLADLLAEESVQQRIISVARFEALGYPDAFFDWVVYEMQDAPASAEPFSEARRVLKPGGWLYVICPTSDATTAGDWLTTLMAHADLVVAEAPRCFTEEGTPCMHGIYRRVEINTSV